ncbi:hypothetical protein GCM10028778_23530 [Barrientosiimonas marina]|uniref:YwdI family protein n=1 Tax=Lentibacillus kimchii TaxID=1542911 RepID=A0ABW2UZ68_9BACI
MAVETRTILQKIQRELTSAQQTIADEKTMKKHLESIQVLSELLLDETPESSSSASPAASSRDVNTAEVKAMMGNQSSESKSQRTTAPDDHDGANGDSLFDF